MTAAVEHAILTPVPALHLRDGQQVCAAAGQVAFGSQAWDFFEYAATGQPVLIYASMNDGDTRPIVSWQATYQRYVRAENWSRRDRGTYRPPSCLSGDEEDYWAGFYLVSNLRSLDDPIEIRMLGDAYGKPYGEGFVPEGPIAVTLLR